MASGSGEGWKDEDVPELTESHEIDILMEPTRAPDEKDCENSEPVVTHSAAGGKKRKSSSEIGVSEKRNCSESVNSNNGISINPEVVASTSVSSQSASGPGRRNDSVNVSDYPTNHWTGKGSSPGVKLLASWDWVKTKNHLYHEIKERAGGRISILLEVERLEPFVSVYKQIRLRYKVFDFEHTVVRGVRTTQQRHYATVQLTYEHPDDITFDIQINDTGVASYNNVTIDVIVKACEVAFGTALL